jgi:hemoglobin-like flavoprotein
MTNMTSRQIELVRESFRRVKPISDAAARLFYQRLFRLDPSLQPMFGGDMEAQGRKLMRMIGALVGSLDRLDQVLPVLADLGRRHAGYGVRDSHYATAGAALLWTLEQALAEAFTADVRGAWVALYQTVSRVMLENAPAAAA